MSAKRLSFPKALKNKGFSLIEMTIALMIGAVVGGTLDIRFMVYSESESN